MEGDGWGGAVLEESEKASLIGEQTLEGSKGVSIWGEEHSRQMSCKHQDPEMGVCLE